MTAVTFDTLKLARRLEGAGFTRAQADGAAEALADSLSNEIATKSDIVELRAALITAQSTLSAETASVESKLSTRISSVESKLSKEIASLESKVSTEISSLRSATAQWIITAVFINSAALIGAVATVWQLAHK